jgi:hypothetical protein
LITRLGRLTGANAVRRNHALEHAAITVITERHPSVFLRGRSNRSGFYIYGEVDTEELRSAIAEAQRRLRAGEAELAIHPRCGTNLAVAGILSGLAAALATQLRPRENRFSYAILASLGALMVSPQVGTVAQRRVTTLADLHDLQVVSIEPRRSLNPARRSWRESSHWVKTHST